MQRFDYCCSRDGHGLSYPGFSVVFIQTFSLHHTLRFAVEQSAFSPDNEMIMADLANVPIGYMPQDIEKQIFNIGEGLEDFPSKYKVKTLFPIPVIADRSFPWPKSRATSVKVLPESSAYRFSLRGFDFQMPIALEDDGPAEVILKGHAYVQLSLFFGNTISLTYRFLFDSKSAEIIDGISGENTSANTNHVIALLSTFLAGEYWSRDLKGSDDAPEPKSYIDLKTTLYIDNFLYDSEGNPIEQQSEQIKLETSGRTFDPICSTYKKFIYKHCIAFREGLELEQMKNVLPEIELQTNSAKDDLHYAMVDIWENVQHIYSKGHDLFAKIKGFSEAKIVNHIRDFHAPELIGLMTLYPMEWRYRDANAYDEVCGENIAIDTDDLVLAGTNVSVVIGTYGRRGADDDGVNWEDHLKERAQYHVSWPEYLLILQMALAKKYTINMVKDMLIDVSLKAKGDSSEKMIGDNADLSMRLNRKLLQLDAVKYSKFASHVVMSDRTSRRLRLAEDMEQLRTVIEMIDNSLQNISNYKAMKSDFFLNMVLAIISIASTFELLFQESEMPFLTYFGIHSRGIAAYLVAVVAGVTLFALMVVLKNALKKFWFIFVK